MIKTLVLMTATLVGKASMAQDFEPTYPCLEFSTSSNCARFPFLPPSPETSSSGTKITCELKAKTFSSLASQRQVPQLDCVFGQCTPAGYGLIWYLTRRSLSTKDSPRVLLSTQDFVQDSLQRDEQKVTVAFNAPQSFFDFSSQSQVGIDALNKETMRLNTQAFVVSVKDLLQGVKHSIKVGVLDQKNLLSLVDADISCRAVK